ncbi:hypothetical protein HKD37_09G026629 [Glycine soja]
MLVYLVHFISYEKVSSKEDLEVHVEDLAKQGDPLSVEENSPSTKKNPREYKVREQCAQCTISSSSEAFVASRA